MNNYIFYNVLDLATAIANDKNHSGYYIISMKKQSLFVISSLDGTSTLNGITDVYEVRLTALKYQEVKRGLNISFNEPDILTGFMKQVQATPDTHDFISLFNHSLRSEKIDALLKPTP